MLFSEPNFLHALNLGVRNTVMVMSSNCIKVIIFVARICNCLEWNLLKKLWRQMVMSLGLSAIETFSHLYFNQLQGCIQIDKLYKHRLFLCCCFSVFLHLQF